MKYTEPKPIGMKVRYDLKTFQEVNVRKDMKSSKIEAVWIHINTSHI